MPRSKRSKTVVLTKVEKKTREAKQEIIKQIREAFDIYDTVYVIDSHNMNSSSWQQLRTAMKDCARIFMGKNQLMRYALGKTEEESYRSKTWQLGRLLKGMTGLLFTSAPEEKVRSALASAARPCLARGGDVATKTIVIPQGPLDRDKYSFALEPELRKLGLPTSLQNTVIHVLCDHVLCKEGDILTSAQARLLKHLDHVLSESSVTIRGVWHKATEDLDVLDANCLYLLDTAPAEEDEQSD